MWCAIRLVDIPFATHISCCYKGIKERVRTGEVREGRRSHRTKQKRDTACGLTALRARYYLLSIQNSSQTSQTSITSYSKNKLARDSVSRVLNSSQTTDVGAWWSDWQSGRLTAHSGRKDASDTSAEESDSATFAVRLVRRFFRCCNSLAHIERCICP
jgi:hypothetical protein